MKQTLQIFVQNPYQDTGQTNYTGFSNNLSFNPTVEELNRTATASGEILQGSFREAAPRPLSAGAIRVVDSVLRARVPESAIRRDKDGDS